MFTDKEPERSSLDIWADQEEVIAIRRFCEMILDDTHSNKDDQVFPDFHFLITQPDNGVEWCKKALDYAEEQHIIFPRDAYDMNVRPVNIDIFRKVRNHRKASRPNKKGDTRRDSQ